MKYPVPARWRCAIIDVHDGDTIRVEIDRGMDDESIRWIRLRDVFAPELSQLGGVECRTFVETWIRAHTDNTVWPFMLETFRTPRSDIDVVTLSRFVGMITAADGSNLNTDVQAYIKVQGYGGGIGA